MIVCIINDAVKGDTTAELYGKLQLSSTSNQGISVPYVIQNINFCTIFGLSRYEVSTTTCIKICVHLRGHVQMTSVLRGRARV